jgi:hypothetical protein
MIRLTRAPDAGGLLRRMTFRIDGRPVARLRRGHSADIELAAGAHVAEASMDWLRSEPVRLNLADGTSVALTGALTEHSATFTGSFLRPRKALELRAS